MARTGFPPGGVPGRKQMEEVRGDAPALVEVELRAVRVDLDPPSSRHCDVIVPKQSLG